MRCVPRQRGESGSLLSGILHRDLLRVEQVLERVRHALERRAHVARLLDRPLEDLDADGHQSSGLVAESLARRGVLTARSCATSRCVAGASTPG